MGVKWFHVVFDTIKRILQRDTSHKIRPVFRRKGMNGKNSKGRRSCYVDESEWPVFENTHETIVCRETFDNVKPTSRNTRWQKGANSG